MASGSAFWYTKVRSRVDLQVGGSQFAIQPATSVLWYLAAELPAVPRELVLNAPVREPAGTPFPVQVLAYADDGTATPAAGAIDLRQRRAGDDGRLRQRAGQCSSGTGSAQIQATLGDDIPSAVTPICSFDAVTECAAARGG